MKKSLKLLSKIIVLLFVLASCTQNGQQSLTSNEHDKEIRKLISEMTIEEKVGQMTQIVVSRFFLKDGKTLLEDSLKKCITDRGVGSILGLYTLNDVAQTLEEWQTLVTKIQDCAMQSRLKIPVIYGIDAIHGASYVVGSTLFPHNIGLGATRNVELSRVTAAINSKETRASGVRWNFDPVLDLGRQPLWSRFEETFGEDSYLAGEMGVAAIKGYEENGLKDITAVASCMKHYLGYSVPANGKDRTPAYISDIVLHDLFVPPFRKAVEAGSSTVMVNSASINGVPVHANHYLLTDLLKNELGFKGFVVTDWSDIVKLHWQHKITKNNRESVKIAINAGIDMSMVPYDLSFYYDLIDLVKTGEVSMSRIDDAVYRILKVKFDLGLFDNPYPEKEALANFGLPEYADVALDAASESVTLLKNDTIKQKPVLPIKKSAKILLAGPCANSKAALHGSWSYTWQGNNEAIYPESTKTILKALEDKIGKSNVICASPEGFDTVQTKEINHLKANAYKVDCIILCLGEKAYAETPGNTDDILLPKDQLALANAAIATNKPVILVLTEGRPLILNDIEPGMNAVLMAYRPASKGADAIANVLFGDYNPNGVLPFSYPRKTGNIIMYDDPVKDSHYYKPQWPFGYGLSYTQFSYSDIKLSADTIIGAQDLKVAIDITNTGAMDGKLAVDLFTTDKVASVIPAMKKLRKFTKIDLKSGETKTVEFTLNKDDLAFVNAQLKTVTEEGDFSIQIGDKTTMFYYKE